MFRNWLKGKKTFLVAGLTVALGIAQACGVPIPPIVYPLLAAAGLGSLRAGVRSVSKTVSKDKKK